MKRHSIRWAVLLLLCGLHGALARAGTVTVTEPVMRYGLGDLRGAVYSPDGKIRGSLSGIGVVLWDAASDKKIRVLCDPTHEICCFAVSSGTPRVLTGGADKTARLWDLASGKQIQVLSGHEEKVLSVSFSPDNTKALTGSHDKSAILWDLSSGTNIKTFQHGTYVFCVAFSQDGSRILTAGDDGGRNGAVILWNAQTGGKIRTFGDYGYNGELRYGGLRSAALSPPDGSLVLASTCINTAILWESATGNIRHTLAGHSGAVTSVAFSPAGDRMLTSCIDNKVRIWRVSSGDEIMTLTGQKGWVWSAEFSPDGARVLSASADQTLWVWNSETGNNLDTIEEFTRAVRAATLSPGGDLVLTGDEDNLATLWDRVSAKRIGVFRGHTGRVEAVAFSPDGTNLLTGSMDGTVRVWETASGTPLRTLGESSHPVRSALFSPDGKKVLMGFEQQYKGDPTVRLWDISNGQEVGSFLHPGYVNSPAFSSDGQKVLTAGWSARLWNTATGSEIREIASAYITCAAYSPDDTKALTGDQNGLVKIWSVSTGDLLSTLTLEGGATPAPVTCVAFSRDGAAVLAGRQDGTATLWGADSGVVKRTISAHADEIRSAAFCPDGTKTLTAGQDGLALLWDTGTSSQTASVRKLDKIILVAGGGAYTGNSIITQTKTLAELAHKTATARGCTPENIFYLSAFDTPATNLNVNAAASSAAILDAIRSWASDASRLLVMLVGHGDKNLTIPDWYFLVDGTQSPDDYLAASTLKTVLDEVQSGPGPLPEICLYVDACYAGGFVKKCSGSPPGAKRLILAGTTDQRVASFGLEDGALSFTGFFLSSALLGNTFRDCFESARAAIAALKIPPASPQTPWLDDDGDARYTRDGGNVARTWVLGHVPGYGYLAPEILETDFGAPSALVLGSEPAGAAQPGRMVSSGSGKRVSCRMGVGETKTVRVVVSDHAASYSSAEPVTNFQVLDLTRELGDPSLWTAPAPDLGQARTVSFIFIANRDDGFGFNLYAQPAVKTIHLNADADSAWILYE